MMMMMMMMIWDESSDLANDDMKVEKKTTAKRRVPRWREDPTLPAGWKIREVESQGQLVEQILSPEAKIFPTIRLALKHLLETGKLGEEVELMRNKLVAEGWQEEQGLPKSC